MMTAAQCLMPRRNLLIKTEQSKDPGDDIQKCTALLLAFIRVEKIWVPECGKCLHFQVCLHGLLTLSVIHSGGNDLVQPLKVLHSILRNSWWTQALKVSVGRMFS